MRNLFFQYINFSINEINLCLTFVVLFYVEVGTEGAALNLIVVNNVVKRHSC